MFPIIEKWIVRIIYGFNLAAGACIVAMMFLTCADVFLRLFRRPVPGAYEIVGFLGALFISFSLAYTSYQKGHIAVGFLIQKLSAGTQVVIMCINDILGSAFFAVTAMQCVIYGNGLRLNGEVSMTLKMPVFPVVYGIGIGCGLLSLLLFYLGVSNIFYKIFHRVPE